MFSRKLFRRRIGKPSRSRLATQELFQSIYLLSDFLLLRGMMDVFVNVLVI